MFEITKTFINPKGLQITPIIFEGNPIFLCSEIEEQLGYTQLSDNLKRNTVMREGKDYIKIEGDNLRQLKELTSLPCLTRSPINQYSSSILVLTESGFYKLLMRSDKELCQEFANWVVDDVLPSIRKTGSYLAKEKIMEEHPLMIITKRFVEIELEQKRQQEEQKRQQEEQLKIQAEQIKFLQNQLNMQKELIDTKKEVKVIESKQDAILKQSDYFSILAYANLHNIPIDLNTAARLGKKASKISREQGIKTSSSPDPRFGTVKLYHISVLENIFASY